jgi:hypothetical protein
MKKTIALLTLLGCCILTCTEKKSIQEIVWPSENFKQTWYAGKAEVSSFTLKQARYGEVRDGEAVLIFVTEDFSNNKLVKLDEPEKINDKTRVLKMNMTKNFVTGVYPYSMMMSVFTPVSNNGKLKTLKANCSSQEWCGHTFSQLKLNGEEYDWKLNSYFEKEGEEERTMDAMWLEDEIWNRLRINPENLPAGKVSLIPGLMWQRFSHKLMQPEEAVCTLSRRSGSDTLAATYSIYYPADNRTLKIYFTDVFPYEIKGWEETYPDGFGNNKKLLQTTAVQKKITWLDYWQLNKNSDSTYRESLQLKNGK